MKDGVVQIDRNGSGRIENADQEFGQDLPKTGRLPAGLGEEAMVGIVSPSASGVGEGKDSGDGPSCGTEYPAGSQADKILGRGLGKDRKKVQTNSLPCRCQNSGIHNGLREKVVGPTNSSAGHLFFSNVSYRPQKVRKFSDKEM
jgi:hypothetical protein